MPILNSFINLLMEEGERIILLTWNLTMVKLEDKRGSHVIDYYKRLFGHSDACSLKLGSNFWPVNFSLKEEDKATLIKTFDLGEIKSVMMEMKESSAPRPDGFGVSFYKHFWESIKEDILVMFKDY